MGPTSQMEILLEHAAPACEIAVQFPVVADFPTPWPDHRAVRLGQAPPGRAGSSPPAPWGQTRFRLRYLDRPR